MLGLFGFIPEAVPGPVPALTGVIKPYSGEVMAPSAVDANLPYVSSMLETGKSFFQ